jgi:hypothetical protein
MSSPDVGIEVGIDNDSGQRKQKPRQIKPFYLAGRMKTFVYWRA